MSRYKLELHDIALFLISFISVFITWFFLTPWSLSHSLMSFDGVTALWPMLNELFNQNGQWQNTLFRAQIAGGAKIHEVFGTQLLFQVMAWLGFETHTAMNLMVLFIQAGIAYFAIKTLQPYLQKHELHLKSGAGWFVNLGIVLLFAFAPFLVWRIHHGHLNLIYGVLILHICVSLIYLFKDNNLGFFSYALAILLLTNAFPSTWLQIVVYSLIFTLPIILYLLKNYGIKASAFALGTAITALLLALPKFAPMILHALSADNARSIGENTAVNLSFNTVSQWLHSFFWSPLNIEQIPLLHEVFIPLGPVVLLLLLTIRNKNWWLLLSFCTSLMLVVFYSANTFNFYNALNSVTPLLKDFRIPARAMIPLVTLWGLIGLRLLLAEIQVHPDSAFKQSFSTLMLAVGISMLVAFLSPAMGELFAWLIFAGLIGACFTKLKVTRSLLAALLFVLGFLSFQSTESLRGEMTNITQAKKYLEEIGLQILEQRPDLSQSLNREQLKPLALPRT